MKREDILRRAQAGKTDEGQQYFEGKARSIGTVVVTVAAILLMLVSAAHGRKITEIMILYWVYLSTACLVEFYDTRRRVQCVTGIFSLIMLVYYTGIYVWSILG